MVDKTELINAKKLMPTMEAVTAELCSRSFYYFVQEFWYEIIPETPVWNWHIEYLCNELQQVVERVVRREHKLYDVIVNIPPGTTKSTIATVMLPAWCWVVDARIRALTASYSGALATDHSIKSRDIIRSAKFKRIFPQIAIKQDQDNKTHYKNTKGGERFATSVGGSAMGFHAHILIVDDPLNPKEAASEADRRAANNFLDVTLSTRKVDKNVTPTILIMQRLHQDDCTGNWINKGEKNVKHICLPAELSDKVNPPELKEYYYDGLLDPTRLDRKSLNELRSRLGAYGYAGQMAQEPAPADGGIWQKWIIPIKGDRIPKLEKLGTDWDLAYTKNENNSASAYVTAGKHGNDMYITDLGYDYLEFPDLINFMKRQQEPHYIEAKASGKSAKQTLKQQGIPAIEVEVDGGGDKIGRTRMATPMAESGFVYCDSRIIDKLYADEKQGILGFPNTGTDLNDALVQAINRLLKSKSPRIRRSSVR